MPPKPRPPRPEKPREPEYSWGECPAGAPPLLWEHEARPLWAQVLPAHDCVLLMEKERWLCRGLADGAERWVQPGAAQPDDLAHDARGVVVASGRDVRELDPATGSPRWKQHLAADVASLALDAGTVYAATDGPIFALDRPQRGEARVRWRTRASADSTLHPYPEGNLLLVSDPDAESVRAFDAATGAEQWTYSANSEPLVVGPIAGGLVWLSAHEAGVVALDVSLGRPTFELHTGRSFEAAGVAVGDALLFTDGIVHAVAPATGKVLWRLELEDEEDGVFSLWADGDTVLAETWRGRLLCLDPADGAIRWEAAPGQVHGVSGDADRLYLRLSVSHPEEHWAAVALSRSTGALQWELKARRMVSDITVAGHVLVVELRTQVLALDIGR